MIIHDIECPINGFGCLIETEEGIQIRVCDEQKEAKELGRRYSRGLITLLEFKNSMNVVMNRPAVNVDIAFVK